MQRSSQRGVTSAAVLASETLVALVAVDRLVSKSIDGLQRAPKRCFMVSAKHFDIIRALDNRPEEASCQEDDMGLCSCMAKCISELILIAINCVLALGGALVLYVGIYLRHSGWVEVIQGYWSPIDGIITALIVIGAVIIGLAVLGSIAALCRWRFGLCVYAGVVLLAFVLFVVVAVAAFVLRHRAESWEDTTYPASSSEESVKADFDQVYCYTQGAYICNQASVSDALTMFIPTLDSSMTSLFENMTGGVNALCDDYLSDFDVLSKVCDGCDQARKFKNFSSLIDWTNEQCEPTSAVLVWCGAFLVSGNTNSSSGDAPYSECRTEFLNLVEKYAFWMGIGSIIVCAGALMVVTFACILRHRDRRPQAQAAYGRF